MKPKTIKPYILYNANEPTEKRWSAYHPKKQRKQFKSRTEAEHHAGIKYTSQDAIKNTTHDSKKE